MTKYRGFEGEVSEMDGLNIINAQGNYEQGRGADGLGFTIPRFNYRTSRYGAGVPDSGRPRRISGKPQPPVGLDPQYLEPRTYMGRQYTRIQLEKKLPRITRPLMTTGVYRPRPGEYDIPKMSVGLIDPRKVVRRRRPNKAQVTRDRQRFVNWIKKFAPRLYLDAKKKADQVQLNEGALGELSGWWDTFTSSVQDLGGKYLQFRTQKEILEAQLERMRQGLPPLETGQIAPTIRIQPDPGTTREITGAIGAGFGRMLPFIAIGGLVLVLMMRRR